MASFVAVTAISFNGAVNFTAEQEFATSTLAAATSAKYKARAEVILTSYRLLRGNCFRCQTVSSLPWEHRLSSCYKADQFRTTRSLPSLLKSECALCQSPPKFDEVCCLRSSVAWFIDRLRALKESSWSLPDSHSDADLLCLKADRIIKEAKCDCKSKEMALFCARRASDLERFTLSYPFKNYLLPWQ